MAITITIAGSDRTAYVPLLGDSQYGLPGLRIEQDAASYVSRCSFGIRDDSGALTITTKQVVTIADGGTTLFGGEIASVRRFQVGPARCMVIQVQDYNVLLEETAIPGVDYALGTADSAMIADLFSSYRSDIDASTYVSTIDASMETMTFKNTLRQCLSQICTRTGGRFYVDFDKKLHYFSAESNASSWNLSTSPNFSTTYPFGDYDKTEDASELVDHVYVVGQGVEGWVGSGDREAIVFDNRITTNQGVTDRGTQIIARHGSAKAIYKLIQWKDGLRAGMSIEVTNSVWGMSATSLVIRKLTMDCLSAEGTLRAYKLELGDDAYTAAQGERTIVDAIGVVVDPIAETVFDVDSPSAPDLQIANLTSGVSVDADGHQIVYIQMTWGSVSDGDLDYYEAQISTSSDFSSYVISRQQKAGGDRIERFVGVLGNTTYYARVRAVDWVGNASSWSTTRSITTSKDSSAPAQVTGLVAAGARTCINLTWTRNTEADMAYYKVERSPTGSGSWTTKGDVLLDFFIDTDFTEAQIQAGTTFYYRVSAVDTSGNTGTVSSTANAALNPLGSDSIAALAIVTAKLAAGAVTAAKISVSQLSAIAADMGTITAGTVTGATIRTAASGQRVQLDSSNGIIVYNSSGDVVFQVNVTGAGQIGKTGLDPIIWNAAGQLDKINVNQITVGPGGFNVLENSAFIHDDDDDGIPDEWTESNTATNYAHAQSTSYYIVGGVSHYIELTSTNPNAKGASIYQIVTLADVGLRVGDDFVLSGYMATGVTANVALKIYVEWLSAAYAVLQTDTVASVTTTTDWTRYTVTNTIPSGAVYASVVIMAITTATNGVGWLLADAIQLERGDLVTQWRPGLIGNLTIDSSRIQITDGTDKIFIGKTGSDLGMFGYDGSTLQVAWYAAGSNAGKIVAGAGNVIIEANGIAIESTTTYTDLQSYRMTVSGALIAQVQAYQNASTRGCQLYVPESTSVDSMVFVLAEGGTGQYGEAWLRAKGNADAYDSYIRVIAGLSSLEAVQIITGNILVNDDENANMTQGLTINQGATDDQILALKSSDVGHGCTDYAEADTFGVFKKSAATAGGLLVQGIRDSGGAAGQAIHIEAILDETAADTTKSTSGIGVIHLAAMIRSGTGGKGCGTDENLMTLANYATTRFIWDAEGSAHADVEWTTYDEHDDLALLERLEQTAVSQEFGGWVEENRRELERLNIAHFDETPGHAVVNFTRLSMLLVGALRQMGRRLSGIEGKMLAAGGEINMDGQDGQDGELAADEHGWGELTWMDRMNRMGN
jgi:hypothetical protein